MSLSDIHNQTPSMRVWIIQANPFLLWLAMHMDFWGVKPQMYVLLHAVIPRYLLFQLLCTTIWARLCSKELCQANVKRCLKDPWTHVFQSFCSSRCNGSGCVNIWGNIEEENMHIMHGLGWQFQFCCQYFAEALTFKVDWCCHHDSTLCISTESKSRWIYWGMEESDSAKKFIDGKNLQIQYPTIPLMSCRYTFQSVDW